VFRQHCSSRTCTPEGGMVTHRRVYEVEKQKLPGNRSPLPGAKGMLDQEVSYDIQPLSQALPVAGLIILSDGRNLEKLIRFNIITND